MKIEIGAGHIWITFENGCVLSIFNGAGSYSDNYDGISFNNMLTKDRWISSNVEIAIIDEQGNFITDKILHNGDDVKGHVSVEELLDIINQLRSEFND